MSAPETVTLDSLKTLRKDYFLARWEEGELTMEPFCYCGQALPENYYCSACGHQCQCTHIVCDSTETLQAAERFVRGNPTFGNFRTSLLGS